MTGAKKKKTKIFLVDDHSIVREGLKRLLESESDFEICGEAENGDQALARIPAAKPDMAVIDLGLQGMNGIELIKNLKHDHPHLHLLVMSMYEESVYAERVLRAGAKGFIMKKGKPAEVIDAIRRVLSGKIYLSDQMTEKMMDKVANNHTSSASAIETLSDREFEVFERIGKGFKIKKIADELHISIKTAESYREQIKHKLNFETAPDLTEFAIQWNLKNKISL